MNRRNVFAAIAGLFGGAVARAQQWKECVPRKGVWQQPEGLNDKFCSEQFEAALNNQCPVCGTMAEPYRIDKPIENCKDWVAGGEAHMFDHPEGCGYVPSRLFRCKRCNAAFWQDAELLRDTGHQGTP